MKRLPWVWVRRCYWGYWPDSTILLGLPIGQLRRPAPALRMLLNGTAIGILMFLLWDVLAHAWEPIDAALAAIHEGTGSIGPVMGYGSLFAAGLATGLLTLVAYEGRMLRRPSPTSTSFGPAPWQPRRCPAEGPAWRDGPLRNGFRS